MVGRKVSLSVIKTIFQTDLALPVPECLLSLRFHGHFPHEPGLAGAY